MKVKSRITEIICLIVIIAVVSIIVINIKDALNKTELEKMQGVEELSKIVGDNVIVEGAEQLPEADKISLEKGSIAVIDIPSVGIRGQVVEGTSDAVLKNYIGKFIESAGPGENGNFCVAAHNNIYTEIFRNLYKVKVNSEVRVITQNKEYIYLVKSINKIQPTQIEVLEENKDLHEITLITCSDMSRTRIVVKGDLISQKDIT